MIDITQHLGKMNENTSRPRRIIIRFSHGSYRDSVWEAMKNAFLGQNHLRLAKDICTADQEKRATLYLLVNAERQVGEVAYYRGPCTFSNAKEIKVDGES